MARRLLTLLAALVLAFSLGQSSASAASFANPVKAQKGADPWISYHNGNYYMVTTSWTDLITMRRSPTLGGLATAPSVQVFKGDAASRCCNIWAPEIHYDDASGRWYLYYVAGQNVADYNPTQRTHVAVSAGGDPMGPYTYKSTLNGSWMLDPTVGTINGKLYLFGSASGGGTQNIVAAPMSNPYTVSGSFSTVSTPTYSWEKSGAAVNEGPELLQHGGATYLVYSASGCWTPDYSLGQLKLTGSNPLAASSWTKKSTAIFKTSTTNGVYGPGHNGFFNSPDGQQSWIVYHANDASTDGCDNGRTTRAQGFGWNSDGSPNLGTPNKLGASITGPSGEPSSTTTTYTLTNRNSGKCLEVAGSSTAEGANVQQYTCNGSAGQKWRIEDQGDDTSRLVNAASGKVLDTADCSAADGADLRQWSWLNNTCQRYRFVVTDSAYVRVVNQATGKVADVADCSTANGADVRQWSWLGNNCQQWRLDPA
ncbi:MULTISPECIES: family 43 glycosylhydrolase [unclassified Streptomyces]|uniref:family 43 glycosylhydrolase n=1 Tax=unclassified Streptomyces TaxID=2593676 RepID=UPI00278C210E|nr:MULTISPECIES: family 43 glycosylhydrolase [unclassified Streptomyces]